MKSYPIDGKVFYETLDEVFRASSKERTALFAGVNFHVLEDRIILEATNRYMILCGQVRADDEADPVVRYPEEEQPGLFLDPKQVRALKTMMKLHGLDKTGRVHAEDTSEGFMLTVDGQRGTRLAALTESNPSFPVARRFLPTDWASEPYVSVRGENLGARKQLAFHFRTDLQDSPQLVTQSRGFSHLTLTGVVQPYSTPDDRPAPERHV